MAYSMLVYTLNYGANEVFQQRVNFPSTSSEIISSTKKRGNMEKEHVCQKTLRLQQRYIQSNHSFVLTGPRTYIRHMVLADTKPVGEL